MAKWIQRVRERMRRRGTVGAFRRQAQRAGMTTAQFARKVLKRPARYSRRTVLRARLALTLMRLRRGKR